MRKGKHIENESAATYKTVNVTCKLHISFIKCLFRLWTLQKGLISDTSWTKLGLELHAASAATPDSLLWHKVVWSVQARGNGISLGITVVFMYEYTTLIHTLKPVEEKKDEKGGSVVMEPTQSLWWGCVAFLASLITFYECNYLCCWFWPQPDL